MKNNNMATYSTLSEAINDLTRKGYTENFNIESDCIVCKENMLRLQPDEFEIDEVYRFQEMSDLDNESILYAISSEANNIKGLLVNAYGTYSDAATTELVRKLEHKNK
ncbi:MAG: phosphoribosylpyrophosphate synthetase [Fermentimonas sp.]|nr:phosphoribosylpyrophosphate synthetase [Fermentimonas sp.]